MASLDGFQLLPLPEQLFLPSSNNGPVNFFIPSQPPMLPCLSGAPYTLMQGPSHFPQMGIGLFQSQEFPQIYDYPNPSFHQYMIDASDKSESLDGDIQSMTSSQGKNSNGTSSTPQPKDNLSWVEQLNYVLRDIYRFCESEKSVADCQLILDILINSNREFFDLLSKLTSQEKRKVSQDSDPSPTNNTINNETALNPTPPTKSVHSPHSLTPRLTPNSSLYMLPVSCINSPLSEEGQVVSKPVALNNIPPLAFHVPDISAMTTQSGDSYDRNSSDINSEFVFVNEPLSDPNEDNSELVSEKEEEKTSTEITPIIDPPQQLWSQVIQRSISHSSSRGVSPSPGLISYKGNHKAYTTISDQRIELGPVFSTIYPSGVDHRLGQQSRNRQKQLSEKLASSNKKSLRESRETLEERMARAKEQRNKINEEKQDRLRLQRIKIKEIQASKDEERLQRRLEMQAKLQSANERRQCHLNELRRKAQEEERKVSEIHLINQMGASSRKLELQDELERKQQYVTDRKEELAQSKKQHLEKRIQSYNERKVQLQAEQDAKIARKVEDIKNREIRQQQKRELKEKARQEEVLSKDLTIERKKAVKQFIMQESANFPKLLIKSKKKKASKSETDIEENNDVRMTSLTSFPEEILPFYPYAPSKICNICNTKLHSELYLLAHFRSSRHHESLENIENSEEKKFKLGDRWFIEDLVDTEETKSLSAELQGVQKADKKKAKKLKQKLETNFPKIKPTFNFRSLRSNSSVHMQFSKTFTSLSRILSSHSKSIEKVPLIEENLRQLSDVKNALQTDTKNDAILLFIQSDGLGILGELVSLISSYIENSYDRITPNFWQIVQTVINCFTIVANNSDRDCTYIVASSGYITCLDIFIQLMRLWVGRWGSYMLYYYQMQSPSHNRVKEDFEYVGVTETLFCLFNFIIVTMKGLPIINNPLIQEVCLDLINYALSNGLMDQIFVIFNVVCGPMNNTDTEGIVLNSMEVLAIITQHLKKDCKIVSNSKSKQSDNLHTLIFSNRLKQFPGMNVTSLLYSIVLHSGPPKPLNASPPKLSDRTVAITTIAFMFINNAFLINHSVMQAGVGSDETRVNEFKLLVSYLIGYSKYYDNTELLDQLIVSVGYFVLFSVQNQDAVQSGRLPTILQHLVDLPFKYFLSPELKNILFPTLISSTYDNENNRDTLKKDVNLQLLSVYINQQLEPGIERDNIPVNNPFDLQWRFPMEDINKVYEFYGIIKP